MDAGRPSAWDWKHSTQVGSLDQGECLRYCRPKYNIRYSMSMSRNIGRCDNHGATAQDNDYEFYVTKLLRIDLQQKDLFPIAPRGAPVPNWMVPVLYMDL